VHGCPVAGLEYLPDHRGPGLRVQAPADDHVVDVCLAERRPGSGDAGTAREPGPWCVQLVRHGFGEVCPDPGKQDRLCRARPPSPGSVLTDMITEVTPLPGLSRHGTAAFRGDCDRRCQPVPGPAPETGQGPCPALWTVVVVPVIDAERARSAMACSYRALTADAGRLGEQDLAAGSRCGGWTRADVLFHVLLDAQRALVTFATAAAAEADADFVSYWEPFRPGSPGSAEQARFVRRASAS
jgi:Mycothiol maleylpyruvate isomerase N-terminal domain